jgi:hypothetical protein
MPNDSTLSQAEKGVKPVFRRSSRVLFEELIPKLARTGPRASPEETAEIRRILKLQRGGNFRHVQRGMYQEPLGFEQEAVANKLPRGSPGLVQNAFAQVAGRDLEHPGIGGNRTYLDEMGFQGCAKLLNDGLRSSCPRRSASLSAAINTRGCSQSGADINLGKVYIYRSRLEFNRHYPSDITVGAVIGVYFAVLVALKSKLALTSSFFSVKTLN